MRPFYFILVNKKPVVSNRDQWADLFEFHNRRVRITYLLDCYVSTVFLGFDHSFSDNGPPLLFETMVFDDTEEKYMSRYSTWDQAVLGHTITVKHIQHTSTREVIAYVGAVFGIMLMINSLHTLFQLTLKI